MVIQLLLNRYRRNSRFGAAVYREMDKSSAFNQIFESTLD